MPNTTAKPQTPVAKPDPPKPDAPEGHGPGSHREEPKAPHSEAKVRVSIPHSCHVSAGEGQQRTYPSFGQEPFNLPLSRPYEFATTASLPYGENPNLISRLAFQALAEAPVEVAQPNHGVAGLFDAPAMPDVSALDSNERLKSLSWSLLVTQRVLLRERRGRLAAEENQEMLRRQLDYAMARLEMMASVKGGTRK